jgi:small subunit ribosomal protein S9
LAADIIITTGRRKEAVARARLAAGEGRLTVNEKEPLAYFGRKLLEQAVRKPLNVANAASRYDIAIRVAGGGPTGQAGAAVHAIARALVAADIELRPILKSGGFLTRDGRAKERKKPGLKRARKAPQYTKR